MTCAWSNTHLIIWKPCELDTINAPFKSEAQVGETVSPVEVHTASELHVWVRTEVCLTPEARFLISTLFSFPMFIYLHLFTYLSVLHFFSGILLNHKGRYLTRTLRTCVHCVTRTALCGRHDGGTNEEEADWVAYKQREVGMSEMKWNFCCFPAEF